MTERRPSDRTPVLYEHVSCELLLTNSCNLRCCYCIARDLPGPRMSKEIGLKALDLFLHLADGANSLEITFTGGEPLLEFQLIQELTKYAKQRAAAAGMDLSFVLRTNGTILDRSVLRYMHEHCSRVVISIDGTPTAHNECRKDHGEQGTHRVVRRNLLTLLRESVPCVASLTVHPRLSRLVLQNVRYLHALGVTYVDVGPAYGINAWSATESAALAQSLWDVGLYMREVNGTGVRLEVGPLFRDSEHVGEKLAGCWGCQAATSNLAFLPTGQITGCSALAMLAPTFPELILGDVSAGLDPQVVARFAQVAQAPAENRPTCRACKTAPNCRGGCLAINYSTTGTPLSPPEFYCRTISMIPPAWQQAWEGGD